MNQSFRYKYSRRILVGLIFCCLGDAFLIWPGYFELGMLSFAIGHINYILAFGFQPLNLTLGVCLCAINIMGTVPNFPSETLVIFSYCRSSILDAWLTWCTRSWCHDLHFYFDYNDVEGHRKSTVFWSKTPKPLIKSPISIIYLQDLWTWSKLCSCIGAILFVISDLILGLDRFKFSIEYSQVTTLTTLLLFSVTKIFFQALVMSTYYAAQLGIALSVVDAKTQPTVRSH